MSNQIVAVGEEDFTLGFELVGLNAHRAAELEELLKRKDIGIIILSQEEYDNQSSRVQQKIDTSIKPIVVLLSQEDVKGGHLREAVIRALGVDVLAQQEKKK